MMRQKKLVELLLLVGVDPSKKDETGFTPLQLAQDRENFVVTEKLREPRPLLDTRRANMAALCAKRKVVNYKQRPPRPLEIRFDSDPDEAETTFMLDENSLQGHNQKNIGPEDAARKIAQDYTTQELKNIRFPPLPRGMVLPEFLILPYAKSNLGNNLKVSQLHNLMFTLNEAARHAERRSGLTQFQFYAQSKKLLAEADDLENEFDFRSQDDAVLIRAAGLLPILESANQIYQPPCFSSSSFSSSSSSKIDSRTDAQPSSFPLPKIEWTSNERRNIPATTENEEKKVQQI
uniref:Uncharacterized protein n=1 Tax=Aureoumbra lagunensis TaxID=44058 RepID=A0A7S3K0D8_9STRA